MTPDTIAANDCLTLLAALPDRSVDCVLTDPPYYRVKGAFDFQWPTQEDYLADAEAWATEMARVLRPSGSLVWFCSDRMAAHIQVMLERHFHYLNSCTVSKRNSIQRNLASIAHQRRWLVNEERFLFMAPLGAEVSDDNPAVLARCRHRYAEGMCLRRVMAPIADYLKGELARAGKTSGDVCRAFRMSVPFHWFTDGSQWELPTREHYEHLRQWLNGDYFTSQYDDLRREYDDLRRPFTLTDRQTDVFTVTQDTGESRRLGHPTVKNLALIRQIVRTVTRPGALILDPFLGSGTTAVAARMEGRHFLGCDTEQKYIDIARRRLEQAQPLLAL